MNTIDITLLKNPETPIMLYSADPKLGANHVALWVEPLQSASIGFSVLVRDEKVFASLRKSFPALQLLYAKSPVDVEAVVTAQPKLKAVLYTTNRAKNIHLLRFNHLRHIFVGTKHSEQLSTFTQAYRAYDEMWVSGAYAAEKIDMQIGKLGHLKIRQIEKPYLTRSAKSKESSVLFRLDSCYPEMLGSMTGWIQSLLTLGYQSVVWMPEKEKTKLALLKDILTSHSLRQEILLITSNDHYEYHLKHSSALVRENQKISIYDLVPDIPIYAYQIKHNFAHPFIEERAFYCFEDVNDFLPLFKSTKENDPARNDRTSIADYLLGKMQSDFERLLGDIVRDVQ